MKPEAIRKAIAYHEAGHAVAARLLGQNIISVTVGESTPGEVLRPSAAYAARESSARKQVAGHEIDGKVALAGPLAQLLSRPNRNDRVARNAKGDGHEGDFQQATQSAVSIVLLLAGESLPESGEKRHITLEDAAADSCLAISKRLRRETKDLLEEHWPAVKRVAKALFERDRLDQAEVDRLIEPQATPHANLF